MVCTQIQTACLVRDGLLDSRVSINVNCLSREEKNVRQYSLQKYEMRVSLRDKRWLDSAFSKNTNCVSR